jgi:hypothetical protein
MEKTANNLIMAWSSKKKLNRAQTLAITTKEDMTLNPSTEDRI